MKSEANIDAISSSGAKCKHAKECSGCKDWSSDYAFTLQSKVEQVLHQLERRAKVEGAQPLEYNIESPNNLRVRDRVDLTFLDGVGPGLYHQDFSSKKIVLVDECQVFSEPLLHFYNEVLKFPWPRWKKASIRLRAFNGRKGIWLDLANQDVKDLLENTELSEKLLSQGWIVEVGQKRKRMVFKDRYRLGEPEFFPWSGTLAPEAQSTSSSVQSTELVSCVGSFTQPGFAVNRLLVRSVLGLFQKIKSKGMGKPLSVVEYGSGIGNFTLPLLRDLQAQVLPVENDPLAKECFTKNIHQNYQQQLLTDGTQCNSALVDPPRSGLMGFVNELNQQASLRNLVYVSCFQDSLLRDLEKLETGGWKIREVIFVDQFPRTDIIETIVHLIR